MLITIQKMATFLAKREKRMLWKSEVLKIEKGKEIKTKTNTKTYQRLGSSEKELNVFPGFNCQKQNRLTLLI